MAHARAEEPSARNSDATAPSLTLKLSSDLQALFTFGTALKPSDEDPANRTILRNEDGTLMGCTVRPALQTGSVYLFVTRHHGDLLVMQDINKRLRELFTKPPEGFTEDCIVLEKVSGRILSLTSSTYSKIPSVKFRVRVSEEGTLTLVTP